MRNCATRQRQLVLKTSANDIFMKHAT